MHLTDEQLNEYLDHEGNDPLWIELHVASCAACAARLTDLQDLFSEIESLPDIHLSPEFALRFVPESNQSVPLPRSFTLTLSLQAVLAGIGVLLAAPFVMQFLSPYVSGLPGLSFAGVALALQSQWVAWLDMLSTFQPPRTPPFPVIDFSSLFMLLTVIGVSLLWLIGNGLLLKNQIK